MSVDQNVLSVKDLSVHYATDEGTAYALNNVSLNIKKGESLGLVGETGAGKTTLALTIMGLLPVPPGVVKSGKIEFNGDNLIGKNEDAMRKVRGKQISMIFQDPMTALNPIDKVGEQIVEVIRLHEKGSQIEANLKAVQVLEQVGIPGERFNDYPHQFSGGMKQRIVIAIALACNPALLIADEPTTALDVTIQAQVLEMMNRLKQDLQTSMLMITHDLGVVAEMCDRVAVVYAGEIVEVGNLVHIYDETMHPYTKGLFGSLPSFAGNSHRLNPIPGLTPDPFNLPSGCKFHTRCPYCEDRCVNEDQGLTEVSDWHFVRCWKCTEVGGQ